MPIELSQIPSPCYVLDEQLLRNNLALIKSVKERAGVDIILAFKAFSMWSAFPIVREYIPYSTASSIHEARLAYEEMGTLAHTYSPAYTEKEFPLILKYSSHITFNSFTQFERFLPMVKAFERPVSLGIRINPEYSEVDTDLYNPCAPGSRMGVIADQMPETLPKEIEGIHFHSLCESTSFNLEKTLEAIEKKFAPYLRQVKWINMGGGHLMTRKGYDTDHLVQILKQFKEKWDLEIIMEPGSAFAWETGILVSQVVDIVENHGIRTAILDVSFTAHMPDCLEMPYKPRIRGAHHEPVSGKPTYRMGGNSCLSGDFIGFWSFDEELKIGDQIVFEDMIHYTMVKTTMFNGVPHPHIAIWNDHLGLKIVRTFGYEDYKNRMS
ncbi:carboxynorspermidine decarboxylase [Breznakibacter xylanolyticus]|uniref:Carboxynorspermidine/carboxyspermidine decarboxylase n=1 Tax=Breznakibacter xylanolyticus TaxID=990 RepID=A0A2W7NAN9_9BACT|nr:carboxynorspermidine decarboxylase [Breznakibacter xylanolyticus]MBN2743603.1 carboxynorspermidine decarboxylase [Marinilabiliaceae bacterium]PZX15157.1 carboxynorspermidine decarboxylase [Breznakibacter xylanolyticus]